MSGNRAVFLDRDGTINEEMGYINHISRFKIFDFAFEAIRILNTLGFKVIVLTNQSGLARGYFDENLLNKVHKSLIENSRKENAVIDQIYFCPHHKNGNVKKYAVECDCRKPRPGMLLKAKQDFNISLTDSYLIGDRHKDIEFASGNGIKAIMVLTGYGFGEYQHQKSNWSVNPDFICDNILDAAKLIQKIET